MSYFGPELRGSGSTTGPEFDVAGAARNVIVRAAEAAPFTLRLSCDTGDLVLVDMTGPVADRDSSVTFEYPAGSQVCRWFVTATGTWEIRPK